MEPAGACGRALELAQVLHGLFGDVIDGAHVDQEGEHPLLERFHLGLCSIPRAPRGLAIEQFWEPDTQHRKLRVVVVHEGSTPTGGHYYAFARTDDVLDSAEGSWHCFSDEQVRPCKWAEVEKEKAYLLFYERLP